MENNNFTKYQDYGPEINFLYQNIQKELVLFHNSPPNVHPELVLKFLKEANEAIHYLRYL